MSISRKLISYFVLLSVLSITILSFWVYKNAELALNKRAFEQLISFKSVKKRQVESFFKDRTSEVVRIKKYFEAREQIHYYSDNTKKDLLLDNILNSYLLTQYYCSITYIDVNSDDNDILYSLSKNDLNKTSSPNREAYQELIAALKIDDSVKIREICSKDTNQPYQILIGAPIKNEKNEIFGTIIFDVNINAINKIMLENNPKEGVGYSGESYIIGADKYFRTDSRFISKSILNKTVNTVGVKNAQMGVDSIGIYPDYRNIEVLGAYSKLNLQNLDWSIVVEIDAYEANYPILEIRSNIIIYAIIISLVAALISVGFARKVTDPIKSLTFAAQKISQRVYSIRLPVESNDEIGILTSAFNDMSDKIEEQKKELAQEQMKRSESIIDAMEEERKRIARELHDGLGQTFIALKLNLESIDFDNQAKALKVVNNVKDSIDDTVDEIRKMSNNIMPSVLKEFGLIRAIKNICNNINELSKTTIHFNEINSTPKFDDKTTIYIFRIAQECINNAFIHANAESINIDVSTLDDFFVMNIIDDGIGFDINTVVKGNGLDNISDRVKLLDGTYDITSQPEIGTKIFIKIPVEQNGKN